MNDSATPRSARQLARDRGLAWVSAITLGAGAASTVGAVALATTMSSATVSSATVSSATAATTSSTGSSSSQLQAAQAPTTTTNPPVATSGAS